MRRAVTAVLREGQMIVAGHFAFFFVGFGFRPLT